MEQFQEGPVRAVGYADDVLLMVVEGKVPGVMATIMQEALIKVGSWAEIHGLSFNPSKTQTSLLGRDRRGGKKEPAMYLDGVALKYGDNVRYLGVTINKRLSWMPHNHIKERFGKCTEGRNKAFFTGMEELF